MTRGLAGVRPTAAYVFRLSAAPFALQMLGQLGAAPPSVLDLDDDEYGRGARFANLHESLGEAALAERERRELPKLQTFQRMFLPRFSASLLANNADRERFAAQYPKLRFEHLPNVVRLPEPAVNRIGGSDSMLFLGTLDYLPNEDAVRHFCTGILPLIRSETPHASVRVAGTGATRSVLDLGNLPGVTIVGTVNDLAAEYQRCGIFVVPLRTGAGSRIKILEAFSYRRPVVSTSAGAEGLSVIDQEHLLIADSPADFASACLRLASDPELCERLAANAYRWLVDTHSLSRARAVLHSLFPEARS